MINFKKTIDYNKIRIIKKSEKINIKKIFI